MTKKSPYVEMLERMNKQLTRRVDRFKESYEEVMPLVSILSHYYPAGIREITDEGKHKGTISVYIDLPAGQCYWRVLPEHLYLFSHLKAYPQAWCGERDVNLARLQKTAKIEQLWEGENGYDGSQNTLDP